MGGHLESWCRRMWTLVILLSLAVGLPQSQLELKLEKSEDFVIGSSCAVEAFSPRATWIYPNWKGAQIALRLQQLMHRTIQSQSPRSSPASTQVETGEDPLPETGG